MKTYTRLPRLVDGLTAADVEQLLNTRRADLARHAAKLYAECHSLRKTASRMGLSHETVRDLLKEQRANTAKEATQ